MEYKVSEYAKIHGVTTRTVWNWINAGELKTRRTHTNRVRILIDEPAREKNVAIYIRISPSEKIDVLEEQKDRLVSFCNARGYRVAKIVEEICTSLDEKRKKLIELLGDKNIDVIVVDTPERICRFSVDFIQRVLNAAGREIVIVNTTREPKEDLRDDFFRVLSLLVPKMCNEPKKIIKRILELIEG